jgi:hypothetical protein
LSEALSSQKCPEVQHLDSATEDIVDHIQYHNIVYYTYEIVFRKENILYTRLKVQNTYDFVGVAHMTL